MRIGDPVTDAVYDRLIKPTVRRVGLTSRRIDRVMHNERIDQKILAELQTADIVLADLTFARPSVYWEAGRAEGQGVPVVYTCKHDHLTPRLGDEFGNYKVHFDVQTTNIIAWKSATDSRFAQNLERRLRYVLRPLLRGRVEAEQQKQEEAAFEALSLAERRQRIADTAVSVGKALGLRGRASSVSSKDFLIDPLWAANAEYGILLSCDGPKIAQEIRVVAVPKLTQRALRAVRYDLTHGLMERQRSRAAAAGGKAIMEHVVAVSFGPVSPALVSETLPNFARSLSGQWPIWSAELMSHAVSGPKPIRRISVLHVLANIRSQRQARQALRDVLTRISSQTN